MQRLKILFLINLLCYFEECIAVNMVSCKFMAERGLIGCIQYCFKKLASKKVWPTMHPHSHIQRKFNHQLTPPACLRCRMRRRCKHTCRPALLWDWNPSRCETAAVMSVKERNFLNKWRTERMEMMNEAKFEN